ncbi:fimbria/pilus outer membrane usher protein [Pseudomonas kulmbachensis]|uniref:fimbria/pilus outer membrane usher protein n=1 Tax=Pseudomonas kulmbachensis TaxID=3043408 RepID=UPI002AB139A5|nr:fimbria/pilus outer membrane usher protein [Pseudomonas sp. V3/3/4/13]
MRSLALGTVVFSSTVTFASTAENLGKSKFSTRFLQNGGQGVDLNDFLQGSTVAAGTYRVDIYVNRSLVGRQDVSFTKQEATGDVQACLTVPIFESLGLDMKLLREAGKLDETRPELCYDLSSLIEQSSVEYDASRQHLNIGVPQASMLRSARGYVDPALWDEGVTAAFTNYYVTGRRNSTEAGNNDSYSVGLNNGINLGPWRLRNDSNISSTEANGVTLTSNRTFAQRDITSLKSQLTLGQTFTSSQVFDSVRIKGLTLASDDAMLPDSLRGYAPTIRGDAETNATIEVRQNNYLLYSTTVAPGPFVLDDIYPNGSNGDLEITVIEADGRRRVTTQPFASLPQMVRRGTFRYNLAMGQYDSNGYYGVAPMVGIAGLAYGVGDNTTLFGGVQGAPDFSAINLGASQNTAIGAFSADVTQSTSTNAAGQRNKGQSARLLYSKTLASTDTTFSLASYRYSTEGYRTLSEHIGDMDFNDRHSRGGRAKSRFDITLNQSLGGRKYGALYLRMGEQRYWNLPGKTQQFSLGYGSNWRSLSYSLNAAHTLSANAQRENSAGTRVSLSLSFPLGSSSRPTRVSSNLSTDNKGAHSLQTGASGSVLGRDDVFYSVNAGHESLGGKTFSGNLNGTTLGAQVGAGYAQGDTFKSLNGTASGSIVAHAGGINFGQTVGESFTLVQVPGVAGVPVGNNAGVTTGANGYAVVPNSQPYRSNWINLDSSQLGADIEIDNTTFQVIPRRGSVTVARFNAKQGRRVQFELVKADGTPMPFGTRVENSQGTQLAIADPSGQALVMVESDKGVLKVKSGALVCEAAYSLPERTSNQGYEQARLVCR